MSTDTPTRELIPWRESITNPAGAGRPIPPALIVAAVGLTGLATYAALHFLAPVASGGVHVAEAVKPAFVLPREPIPPAPTPTEVAELPKPVIVEPSPAPAPARLVAPPVVEAPPRVIVEPAPRVEPAPPVMVIERPAPRRVIVVEREAEPRRRLVEPMRHNIERGFAPMMRLPLPFPLGGLFGRHMGGGFGHGFMGLGFLRR